MKMRALYHKGYNGHTIEKNMPQVFEENEPEKRNFADRYTKLQEETMHRKEIEQIQTVLPMPVDGGGKPLSASGQFLTRTR